MKRIKQRLPIALLIFLLTESVFTFDDVEENNELNGITDITGNSTADLVEETLRLLKFGEENIVLLDDYKDLILVLGNTGAGKSTLTKFLAGNDSQLISYWTPSGFLIMDEEGEISNSTIISRTLLPQLFIDESNVAFYDLPGFSDTRNASIEIANAFFMKRVADHAERVKLAFVVNHYSMISGGDRKDFVAMVNQATSFVKNISKFDKGISLIASKVDKATWNDTLVISGIAYFLGLAANDLPSVIEDPAKLEMSLSLIKSFTTKGDDPLNPYPRIGAFRVPEEEGPLDEIPMFIRMKQLLHEVVHNTEYVNKNSEDFGLSLSEAALLVVKDAVIRVQASISETMIQLRTVAQDVYDETMLDGEAEPDLNLAYILVDQLYGEYLTLSKLVGDLSKEGLTRSEFLEALNQTLVLASPPLTITPATLTLVEKLFYYGGQLGTILEEAVEAPTKDWLLSIEALRDSLATKLLNFATTKIRPELDHSLQKYAEALKSACTAQFNEQFYVNSWLQAFVQADFEILEAFTKDLVTSNSLKDFASKDWNAIQRLSVSVIQTPPLLPPATLEVDLADLQPSLYPLESWTRIFDTSLQLLKLRRDSLLGKQKTEVVSPAVTNWGTWGGFEDCDSGSLVSGIQLQVVHPTKYHSNPTLTKHYPASTPRTTAISALWSLKANDTQKSWCDRWHEERPWTGTMNPDITALNSIRFLCSRAGKGSGEGRTKTITSKMGGQGRWGQELHCPDLRKAIGFELRVESPRPRDYCRSECYYCCWGWWNWICDMFGTWEWGCGDTECLLYDDTATNNLNLICEGGVVLGGEGSSRGDWTGRQICPGGTFLCGIQTQVEDPQGLKDATSLNNVKARCCNYFN